MLYFLNWLNIFIKEYMVYQFSINRVHFNSFLFNLFLFFAMYMVGHDGGKVKEINLTELRFYMPNQS